jgi:P-type Mg2+ transporter
MSPDSKSSIDAPDHAAESFWTKPLADLQAALGSGQEGLPGGEASLRLERHGRNVLLARRRRPLLLEFLAHFLNPLVLLLITASGISALTGETTSFVIISAMVLASVTLDFVQEHRAGQSAERLRQSVALSADVVRGGQLRHVPAAELVPGDVVHLSAGDMVPADGRVIEARDFFVNQSLLTGESYPVEKQERDLAGEAVGLEGASNSVFMGTAVIGGTARAMVCRTGAGSALGAVWRSLAAPAPPTPFEVGTRQFGLFIMRFTLLLVLFVVLVNTFLHRPWLETFLFAVALAVGLTPELLPMVVSVTLARGAIRMARKSVIVKRLASIHDLGSMDVLCTDKTGTLTEGRIRLERHVDPLGRDSGRVLQLAHLNSYFETGLKSPLDDAILAHGDIDVSGWRKIDEVPFGFERRRVSVLVESAEQRLLVVKGAPEDVVSVCTEYERDGAGSLAPLDETVRGPIHERFNSLSREGFRVLGVAWRAVGRNHSHAVVGDESKLVFAGFAAFLDPPKASAAAALKDLARGDVAVKIITGDNELVAQHLCGELGFPITGLLTGAEISRLDDLALQVQAERANVFSRVTPVQKSRLLAALRKRGHVVGFLGDGINDAPALHEADIGISVDGAVDVAKEAAAMIMMKHDLGVLHDGILEGRRTFANIMKYIMMATSSNFGNMFSMAGASLFLPFLPMLPVQILLNNFLYDASEVPIPLDTVDEEFLARPRHWDMAFIRKFMLTIGPISSVFDFFTFFIMLRVFHAGEALFHTGWFIESLATQVLVIFVIRTRLSPLRSRPHPWLAVTSLSVVGVAALLPFTPLSGLLGFAPPPLGFYVVLATLVAAYLGCVEWTKRWFYRRLSVPARRAL